ncbi:MAG: PLxRFG domain-containing protein, partial [Sulfuricaulis sp.]|nr:PLxRFG domain-containing protein [Sulfuricaulis sp.]
MPFDPYTSSEGLDVTKPVAGLDPYAPDPNAPGPFARGVKSGVAGVKSSLWGASALAARGATAVLPAVAAPITQGLEAAALENAAAQNEIAAAGSMTYEDVVADPTRAGEFIKWGLGTAIPSLALMFAGGVVGRGLGALAGRGLAPAAAATAKNVGMFTGAVVPDVAVEAGSIYPEALENKVENPALRSAVGGAAAGAVDFLTLPPALRALMPAKAALTRASGMGALAKTSALEIAKRAPVVGGLEAAQEASQAVIEMLAAGQDITSKEGLSNIINSALIGGIAGTAIGGAAGGFHGVAAPVQDSRVPTDREQVGTSEQAPPVSAPAEIPDLGTSIPDVGTPDPVALHAAASQEVAGVEAVLAQTQVAHDTAVATSGALAAEYEAAKTTPPGERRAKNVILAEKKAAQKAVATTKAELEKVGGTLFAARQKATEIAAQLDPAAAAMASQGVSIAPTPAAATAPAPTIEEQTARAVTGARIAAGGEVPKPAGNVSEIGQTQAERIANATLPDIKELVVAKLTGQGESLIGGISSKVERAVTAALALPTVEERVAAIRATVPKAFAGKLAKVDAQDFADGIARKVGDGTLYSRGGVDKPTTFYRATEPGRTERIKTGDAFWDSHVFASSSEEKARPYGSQIEKITAKPDAKILYEGSREFRSVGKGLTGNMSMLTWASTIAQRAKDAGYDAVHFKRQSDIGTAILNPEKFNRGVTESNAALTQEGFKSRGAIKFEGVWDENADRLVPRGAITWTDGLKGLGASAGHIGATHVATLRKVTGGFVAGIPGWQWKVTPDSGIARFNQVPGDKIVNSPQKFFKTREQAKRAVETVLTPVTESNAALTQDEFDVLPEPAKFAAVDEFNRIMAARGTALRQEIARMLGPRAGLIMKTFMATPDSPIGSYTRVDTLKSVITMALNAQDILGVAHHEGYHAAEDLILTSSERTIIANALKEGRPLRQQLLQRLLQYDRENKTNLTDEVSAIPAEARAYAYEFWKRGELKAESRLDSIFRKLQEFFERIANAVRGLGFKSMEDIFTALDLGQFAERESNAGEGAQFASEAGGDRWYRSALTDAVRALPTKAASVQGWKDQIKGLVGKNDVKQVELDAVGLNEFLDLQQGKVSKDSIMAFLGENGVRVEETQFAEGGMRLDDRAHEMFGVAYYDQLAPEQMAEVREAQANEPSGEPKFASYQLLGGQNYRELLLALPSKLDAEAEARRIMGEQQWLGMHPSLRRELAESQTNGALRGSFRSSHFDQPNVLAHIRFNERVDASGARVLFIEEIQSDWAQKGKKDGFVGKNKVEVTQVQDGMYKGDWAVVVNGEQVAVYPERANSDRVAEDYRSGGRKVAGQIPSAPFVTKTEAWVALSLKRMIRYAAENGFDKVAWANGTQQAARYDLSKQVSEIQSVPRTDVTTGEMTRSVLIQMVDHTSITLGVNAKGIIDNTNSRDAALYGKPLSDVIGKDLAERIMSKRTDLITGSGLKVGGEGMKAFYDKIVPNVANEVLRKLGGGKVENIKFPITGNIATGIEGPLNQPGFTITPELARRAAEGLPLFSEGAVNSRSAAINITPEEIKTDPTPERLVAMLRKSEGKALRYVMDGDGVFHFWDAFKATHKDGSEAAGVPYDYTRRGRVELIDNTYAHFSYADMGVPSESLQRYMVGDKTMFSLAGEEFTGAEMAKIIAEGDDALLRELMAQGEDSSQGAIDPLIPPALRTLYSKAAVQAEAQIATQMQEGELERMQTQASFLAVHENAQVPGPSFEFVTGLAKAEANGFKRWWFANIATPNFVSKSSLGYKNVMNTLNTYIRYRKILAEQMLREKLPSWYKAPDVDRKAAFGVMLKRTVEGYSKDSVELTALLAPLTQEQKTLYTQATGMIEGFLRAQFVKDQAARKTQLTSPGAYEKWEADRKAQVDSMIDKGYVPLRRYGDYSVRVYTETPDGKRIDGGLVFVDSERASLTVAKMYQDEINRTGVNLKVEQGTRDKNVRDTGISIEQFLGTLRRNGVDISQAERERLVLTFTNSESMIRNKLMHREGLPGYSEDSMRVLHEFGVNTSGELAYARFADAIDAASEGRAVTADVNSVNSEPEIQIDERLPNEDGTGYEPIQDFRARNLWTQDGQYSGFYKNISNELSNYVLVPDHSGGWSRRLRAGAMVYFIGGSLSGAVVNAMSIPMLTVPELSIHTNYSNALTTTMGAWKDAWRYYHILRDTEKLTDPSIVIPGISMEMRQAMRAASDHIFDTEIHQMLGMSQGTVYSKSRKVQRAMEAWMAPFRVSEQTNRLTSFMAAYRIGQENKLTGQELFKFASGIVDSTQNNYSESNRPGAARNPVFALMFMFKSFPLFMTEAIALMYKQSPKSAVYMLLGLTMMTGVQGLPFAETIQDLIDTIAQQIFGSPFNSRRAMRNVIKSASEAMVGADLSEVVLRGVINDVLGISVSSRIGAGDFVPGSRLGTADADKGRVLSDMLGAPFAMVKDALTNVGGAVGGLATADWKQVADALRAGGPVAIRNAIKGAEQLNTGFAWDSKGRKVADVNTLSAILQMGGLAPAKVAKLYEFESINVQTKSFHAQFSQELQSQMIKAMRENDTEKVQEINDLRTKWNAEYPTMPIMPNAAATRRAIILAGVPLDQRSRMLWSRRIRG